MKKTTTGKICTVLEVAIIIAFVVLMLFALTGCSKVIGKLNEEPTKAEVKPKPTPIEKVAAAQRYIVAKAAFLKLCDNNGGIKEYDDSSYINRYYTAPLIVCNNGLSSTFRYDKPSDE